MAIQANNPRIRRGRGKTMKVKKDAFSKKEWLSLKAPTTFNNAIVGKTLLSKQGTKHGHEKQLIGRTFESFQNNLIDNGDHFAHQRKFKFSINNIKGSECNSQFAGMTVTSDLRQSIVKRGHSLIERITDIKSSDGYHLRIITIAITKREKTSTKRTCYANTNQIKETRRTMEKVLLEMVDGKSINDIMSMLTDSSIGKEISEKSKLSIGNSHVIKVKVVKKPLVA